MILNTYQIAQMLCISPRGVRNLLKRLKAPLYKHHNKLRLDTNHEHPVCQSLRLQLQKPNVKAIYSVRDLSIRFDRDKKTVLSLINETDIPLYGNYKKYILLYDLVLLEQIVKSREYLGKRERL